MSAKVRFLLDTNTVSYILGQRSAAARKRFAAESIGPPSGELAISTITQAEMLFGLERRPEATRLRLVTEEFLTNIRILSWDPETAHAYARMRVSMIAVGKALSLFDSLIAAQAIALNATLVTHDRAFRHLTPQLLLEDWATDL